MLNSQAKPSMSCTRIGRCHCRVAHRRARCHSHARVVRCRCCRRPGICLCRPNVDARWNGIESDAHVVFDGNRSLHQVDLNFGLQALSPPNPATDVVTVLSSEFTPEALRCLTPRAGSSKVLNSTALTLDECLMPDATPSAPLMASERKPCRRLLLDAN